MLSSRISWARARVAFWGLLLLCGCASLRFQPARTARFADIDARILRVEYGRGPRATPRDERQARLRLPEGQRVLLTRELSSAGMRYICDDRVFVFVEQGGRCLLLRHGEVQFEGIYIGP